jgi:hypothetical protein
MDPDKIRDQEMEAQFRKILSQEMWSSVEYK